MVGNVVVVCVLRQTQVCLYGYASFAEKDVFFLNNEYRTDEYSITNDEVKKINANFRFCIKLEMTVIAYC